VFRERPVKRAAVELRMTPAVGNGTDVRDGRRSMPLEECQKRADGMVGMPDGEHLGRFPWADSTYQGHDRFSILRGRGS